MDSVEVEDYDMFEYELVDSPSNFTEGNYSYLIPESCDGTILTSLRARGFCPTAANGQKVVMQLIYYEAEEFAYRFSAKAECDTSSEVVPGFYEGNVSADNLSISVKGRTYLGITFIPECPHNNCLFQPAIVNVPSKLDLYFGASDGTYNKLNNESLIFVAVFSRQGM